MALSGWSEWGGRAGNVGLVTRSALRGLGAATRRPATRSREVVSAVDGSLAGVVDVRVSVSAQVVMLCAGCGDERAFEQPPCADGHDVCPEWFCVECGVAIFLDPVPVEVVARGRDAAPRDWSRPRGTADTRRHAA